MLDKRLLFARFQVEALVRIQDLDQAGRERVQERRVR